MFGTVTGNVLAVCCFLLFQLCGQLIGRSLLKTEPFCVRLLAGSVLGSVMLQWLPVLGAFFLDFTVKAHILAAALAIVLAAAATFVGRSTPAVREKARLSYAIVPTLVWCVFAWLVISGFEFRDGAVYSSQATYGDMSMHLGFITSIANQQSFPPEYSILPGTQLSYPFLSDSISSSLYIWGCDLRLAYGLPMLFAGAQVMFGAWLLLRRWLGEPVKALLGWVMFFLNGGFGFVYLLRGNFGENLRHMLTAFYETPTNLVGENIRWVNMIVDMLLPQRATLFGYAVLFLSLYLLYRAVWEGERRLFPVVGLLAGTLPMIHTHSFLALVLVSGCWLMTDTARRCRLDFLVQGAKPMLLGGILFLQLLQVILTLLGTRETDVLLAILGIFGLVFLLVLGALCVAYVRRFTWKPLLETWGLYLLIAGVLSLPQLMFWTFGQATGEQFLRGYFNWANIDDVYIWFYVKNIGMTLLLFLAGFLLAGKKNTAVAFPVLIIFLIAELVVFQPNVYDNNKLLYVAYLLMCGIGADFTVELLRRLPLRGVLAAAIVCLCTVSGVLTICREVNAEYQLMELEQMQLAEYVMEHTEPDDVILTNTRHNNAIAALTGRNIFCGSGSYLYFHGLDYQGNEAAAKVMYEESALYPGIFEQYGIDYILVSSHERYAYDVDEWNIVIHYPCVYESATVRLYQVKENHG